MISAPLWLVPGSLAWPLDSSRAWMTARRSSSPAGSEPGREGDQRDRLSPPRNGAGGVHAISLGTWAEVSVG